jgi:hypothetical protein
VHHVLVMVTARDLANGTLRKVVVGPETGRVCEEAMVCLLDLTKEAKVIVTAGYSKKYDVIMGNGTMRRYLVDCMGIPESQIRSPIADEFNTSGEMAELVHYMRTVLQKTANDTFEIYLVASWWHWPRARALLHARLEPWQRTQTEVHAVLASSTAWKDMLREPFAWLKNIRNGNLFWWRHKLYYCAACNTFDCCEIQHGQNYCHRCGTIKRFSVPA